MGRLRENVGQRFIDASPFGEQLGKHPRAVVGQPVEAFVAPGLFAPLADEQALDLQPAQQGVERAFVDGQPVLIGSLQLFAETPGHEVNTAVVETVNRLNADGKTTMTVSQNGEFL